MRPPAPTVEVHSHTQTTTENLHTGLFNMLVNKAIQLTVLAAAILLDSRTDAATSAAVKFCGRQLSEMMTRVCQAYNSPSWDVPTVVEQQGAIVRRKRQVGIANECCIIGCTWDQLTEYCSISAYSESPLEDMEAHMIADRSAEQESTDSRDASPVLAAVPAAAVGSVGHEPGRRGGRRGRGGRARRGRRCWCRRKRRSGRRRTSLMGNMAPVKSAVHRAAPVVGTVSPLITWGRTLNTDLSANRNNYAYVVYA